MIIYPPKRKQKRKINKAPKVLSLAELQERRLNGVEQLDPTRNTKQLKFPYYSEVNMRSFKVCAYDADSFYGIKGVYFLFDEKMNVVYIGESTDCVDRIKMHFDNKDKVFKYFKIFKFDVSDLGRKDIEKKLIKQFNPIYNKVHNKYNYV
jgi:hypothetical protein